MLNNSHEFENKKDKESTKERKLRKRHLIALGAISATLAGLIAVGANGNHESPVPRGQSTTAEANTPTTESEDRLSDAQHRLALEQQLEAAYIDTNGDTLPNDITITDAELLDETVNEAGAERGVIRVHIDGTAKNTEVADSRGNPDYDYRAADDANEAPMSRLMSVNGETVMNEREQKSLARWETTQEAGDALIFPRLEHFAGSEPSVLDYKIQLPASGRLKDGSTLQYAFEAGRVVVTGSNGAITEVNVIPRHEDLPPIEVTETS